MSVQKYGQHDYAYIADDLEDLAALPSLNMGSTCYVISTAEKYMVNSQGQWILQTASTQPSIDLSEYATIAYSDAKDAELLQNTDEHIAYMIQEGNTDLVSALTAHTTNVVQEAVENGETNPTWETLG